MKKNITKEQIVETALELMKDKSDLHSLNLREIARTLGCAHTNLYNYFPSYNDLLWETHASLQELFLNMLAVKLEAASTAEMRLVFFFEAFADMYLDQKGWFRLSWNEYIGGERPQRDIEATKETKEALHHYLSEIWNDLTGVYPEDEKLSRVLHNIHCYIVGEVSNYLSERGLLAHEKELKKYIVRESVSIFKLCLMAE